MARKKSNASRRVTVEAAAKIRASAEIQGAKREKAEAEARAKAEAEFVERARACVDAKEKGEAEIARIANKTRWKAKFETRARKNANAVNRAAV